MYQTAFRALQIVVMSFQQLYSSAPSDGSLFFSDLFPGVLGEKNIDLLKTDDLTEIAHFWETLTFNENSHLILKNFSVKCFRRTSKDEKYPSQHLLFKTLTVNTKYNKNPQDLMKSK